MAKSFPRVEQATLKAADLLLNFAFDFGFANY